MWAVDSWQFLSAVALDLLFGDPRGWPHIARFTGTLAAVSEKALAASVGRTILAGAWLWVGVCGGMLALYTVLHLLLVTLHPLLGWGLDIVVIYQAVAARDLDRHLREVIAPLLDGDLGAARGRLAMMVGRDTAHLDVGEISRAGVESVAESITDGIIAPLFWAVIAGAPGALIYRVANTLDSLVGHRDERYEEMGKVSARIDDCLSWIPARLTALLFWCWQPTLSLRAVAQEAALHASPNAGWGEAAMARVVGIRLGGENRYHGEIVIGPIFNPEGRIATPADLSQASAWMWKTMTLFSTLCFVVLTLRARHILHVY